MAAITRPKNGDCFRITRRGYVDGIFMVEGVRQFKGFCKISDIEKAPSGRLRTPKQLNAIVQQFWDEKCRSLEATLGKPTLDTSAVSQVLEDWRAHTEARGRSPLTLIEIERTSRYYLDLVGEHPVGEAATWHADRFLEGLRTKTMAEASINSHLSRLATFWRFCLDRNLIAALPKVTRVKETRKPRQVPTPEQVTALIRHLEGRIATAKHGRELYFLELHHLLVLVLIGTGMRSGEALNIKREQIDLHHRAIRLEKTKTNQPRICRIPQYLAKAIDERLKAYPFHQYLFGDTPRTPANRPGKPRQPSPRASPATTSKSASRENLNPCTVSGRFSPRLG